MMALVIITTVCFTIGLLAGGLLWGIAGGFYGICYGVGAIRFDLLKQGARKTFFDYAGTAISIGVFIWMLHAFEISGEAVIPALVFGLLLILPPLFGLCILPGLFFYPLLREPRYALGLVARAEPVALVEVVRRITIWRR